MTQVIQESIKMLEMLPESEQEFASQLIRRLVLAWDPEFTKLTPEERKRLETTFTMSCGKRDPDKKY